MPIGRTWQMSAVNILEMLVSTYNNQYLTVVQDYFSKWAEAILLAASIVGDLVKFCCTFFCTFCCTFGLPEIIHTTAHKHVQTQPTGKMYL